MCVCCVRVCVCEYKLAWWVCACVFVCVLYVRKGVQGCVDLRSKGAHASQSLRATLGSLSVSLVRLCLERNE